MIDSSKLRSNATVGPGLPLDFDGCYRASSGREARWDGRVFLGVTSTGIYCKPSCPARKPMPENCRFFSTAAACVAAGFRACKRCRPDALPGSRDWDVRGDLAARAVRRIRDGAVDTLGVAGLAAELAVSERQLRRVLREEIGVGPLQLARTRRASAARTLIEQTDLPLSDVAFAAGFGSIRQFGDTMKEEFGVTPSALPRGRTSSGQRPSGRPVPAAAPNDWPSSDEQPQLAIMLRARAPYDVAGMLAYLTAHAISGRDRISGNGPSSHALDLAGGTGLVTIDWPNVTEQDATVHLPVALKLPRLDDTMAAIGTVRRMLDLDADPAQITESLSTDPVLAALLAVRPGLRVAGARNPAEFVLATVLGQQVSLAAARTLQGRLAQRYAIDAHPTSDATPAWHAAPDVPRIARTSVPELRELGITGARAETLQRVAQALNNGLDLSTGADREHTRASLGALRGIGPWTVEMVALRCLGDPDAFPAGDLILRRALGTDTERATIARAEQWRPFRGYATQQLWADFLAAQEGTGTR